MRYPARMEKLPIEDALPDLCAALRAQTNAVLLAPPGAGKTTRVPLALMTESWAKDGRIVMLEPRRVAARAAAERMAATLGESVGETVGYRIRNEARISGKTRIEVVTEGILTRRLQTDPELAGVACVIFDEFHERSIHADLGLALCLEAQGALREDLRILVMSATLEGGPVAALMDDAPVIESAGRVFPVETRWLEKPMQTGRRGPRFEEAVADLTARAVKEEPGDALVFLPGAGEIRRTETALKNRLSGPFDILPIYGELPFRDQQRALRPAPEGRRKIVLASAIAETSLTIDGVRIVVDGGRARRARFDAGSGMSRLVTERVSRASADQRRGRAGRTAPGVCYRLWTKGEEGGFTPFAPAEILEADLAPLALELAVWGAAPGELAWLDAPPEASFTQATDLLKSLGALDDGGRITAHGQRLAKAPTHPRFAHMILAGVDHGLGGLACDLAALLEERDPLRGVLRSSDMRLRVEALRDTRKFKQDHGVEPDHGVLARVRDAAKRLRKRLDAREGGAPAETGMALALAYPDRVALRRAGEKPRFLLSGGKGAVFDEADRLAKDRLLVIPELDGDATEAGARLAAPIAQGQLETLFEDKIRWENRCEWSRKDQQVRARTQRRFGVLALEDRIWKDAPPEALADGMIDGLRQMGLPALPWDHKAQNFRARVMWLREQGEDLPDMSDEALFNGLADWLAPHLAGFRKKADLERLNLRDALKSMLDWEQAQRLDHLAPESIPTGGGPRAPIDYSSDPPALEVQIKHMFGETRHPTIMDGRVPLLLRFLSPARRPVQTTADLAGFWANSYADVRKDLRGRYPKHPWPEDPTVKPE